MAEKVRRLGVKRVEGYLYFIDKQGDVSRVKMTTNGIRGGKPEKVKKVNIKRQEGYLYFLDKNGDIARAKMIPRNYSKDGMVSISNLDSGVVSRYLNKTMERLKWNEISKRFVFLSYSHKDVKKVRSINRYLKSKGINTWFDKDRLKGGHYWEHEIEKAIKECVLFVTFLSKNSVNSKGHFQSESKTAQKVWEKIPEGSPYIIPVELESNIRIPQSLEKFHRIKESSLLKIKESLYDTLKSQLEKVID